MTLDELNRMPREDAIAALGRCCGASAWAASLCGARPFESAAQLDATAERVWWELGPADWREAFTHHPRIGDLDSLRARFAATANWASAEQAGAAAASDGTLAALAEGNRAYEERFGYTFIVCATGKGADEMLALLRERLGNDAAVELRIAASEQMKITRLRLEKLVAKP